MTTSRKPTSPRWWRRAALAFLACAALAFEMAAPHDMAVEQAEAASSVEIDESAIHPRSPAHFETAELKVHPPCVACLLQAQAGTVRCHLPAAQEPLAREGGLSGAPQRLAAGEIPLTGPARAPPSFSPSLV